MPDYSIKDTPGTFKWMGVNYLCIFAKVTTDDDESNPIRIILSQKEIIPAFPIEKVNQAVVPLDLIFISIALISIPMIRKIKH